MHRLRRAHPPLPASCVDSGVPCIEQEEYSFQGYKDRFALVAHDFQAFHQVAIDWFNNHGIVIGT